MVRGEQHDDHLANAIVGEFVVLAVGAWELELRGGVTDLERVDVRWGCIDEGVSSGGKKPLRASNST